MRILQASLAAALPFLSIAVACSDSGGGIKRLHGQLKTDATVDFGDVQVGILAEYDMEVKNTGNTVVAITKIQGGDAFTDNAYEFKTTPANMMLAPSETKTIKVTFQPFVEMATPAMSSFDIITDIPDSMGKGGFSTVTVEVRGRGVKSGLIVEPNPVDFGKVLAGGSKTVDVKITNALSVPVPVNVKLDASNHPDIVLVQGMGRFEIASPVGDNGSLLQGQEKLDPMVSVIVKLKYTPDPAAINGRPDQARMTISNCAEALCEVTIDLQGQGTDSALDCMPAVVDFGDINPGRTADRMVTCKNVAGDAVNVTGWVASMSTASEFHVEPYAGMPGLLQADESFTISVRFSPTMATLQAHPTGAIVINGMLTTADRPLMPVTIQLKGNAGGPAITVLPTALDFGQVALGTSHRKRLLVQNGGYAPLIVSSAKPDMAGDMIYTADPQMITLAVGTSTVINVTFAPQMEQEYSSNLLIVSNDGSTPTLQVPLHGQGVNLPPCNFSLMPTIVNFGVVNARSTAHQMVRITNTGNNDCLVNDEAIQPQQTDFTLPSPMSNVRIMPGGSHDIAVDFTPRTSGNHTANLTFYISNPQMPDQAVPISGVGQATTQLVCPPDKMTPAGTAVSLPLQIVTMGTTVSSISWAITSSPMGGMGTPNQWTPAPPNAMTEQFLPYIVGSYTLHVTLMDNLGDSYGCDTHVIATGHGLRVELTWDGLADIDLHLHDGDMSTPWFGGFGVSGDDCYYANRQPQWNMTQPAATAENPQLDFDNTSGFGPENTRIDTPVLGQTYTIAVHNFRDGGGRISTINVFCGGVTTPTMTFTSTPMTGGMAGDCNDGSFWKVANVTFSSITSCTITPINTYTTGSMACTSF
jgi:HYDIN/CFA65/VesB family protein